MVTYRPPNCDVMVCNAYQLLPGEACPAYAYRYRLLGRVSFDSHKCHTWTDELLARLGEIKKRQSESMVIWRSKQARYYKNKIPNLTHGAVNKIEAFILTTADKLDKTGSTGWEPYTGLNFVLERSSVVSNTEWNWDLEELYKTKRRYADQDRRTKKQDA